MYLDIATILLIGLGALFMLIASIGLLRLPDFYLRMSAITKAATLGLGMVLLGVAIHFDDIGVFAKSFVIITFLMLTSPVGAHAIARAAYRQGVKFWGKTIVDELELLSQKAQKLEAEWSNDHNNVSVGEELIITLLQLPSSHGGSFNHALVIAKDISMVSPAKGHRLLGVIYSKMGRLEAAETFLQKACIDSNYKEKAVNTLVDFYAEKKLPNKALVVLEKALNIHPENIQYLIKVIHLSFDYGVRHKFGFDCCNRIITLESDVSSDSLLEAARYKRYFIERISGKFD
jgi:multicomponent Na+:H+ antiporter subunit G